MRRAIVLAVLLLPLAASAARAEPVTTIANSGDPANRIDVAILGEGYRASELALFAAHARAVVDGMLGRDPFDAYRLYFNVHRVDVVSAQSGADHPELGTSVDTALGATYGCAGIQRLICVDQGKVNAVLQASLPPAMRDLVIVLVNDAIYGGSGGAVAVLSIHGSAIEILLHEIGHTFGLLADEYGGPPPPACDSSAEPPEANATRATTRAAAKWAPWIDGTTPVPTPGPTVALPGLYAGARYCDTGLFRPTFDSLMRTLGRPFEQVNAEQLIRRIYNVVSPIDGASPTAATVTVDKGTTQAFSVTPMAPATHALAATWRVNGQAVAAGPYFSLDTTSLAVGTHTVQVEVVDPTAKVRSDPAGVLRDRVEWAVTVGMSGNTGPGAPTALGQYRSIGSAPIAVGGPTADVAVVLRGRVSDADAGQTVKLQVEVRRVGTAFANVSTHESAPVASGQVASLTVPALIVGAGYHWQARAIDSVGATSAWVSFGGNGEAATDFIATPPAPSLTAAPTSVARGESVTAAWTGITAASGADWLGLYAAGRADGAYLARLYVNCAQVAGAAVPAGACPFPIAASVPAGAYELRLFRNDSFARLAVSNRFTVTSGNRPPASPAGLGQFRADAVTAIALGGMTAGTTVVVRGALSDPDSGQAVKLQVEVRPLGAAFTGVATHESPLAASGSPGAATLAALAVGVGHHWQARAVDAAGAASAWVAFGGNAESAADFVVSTGNTPPGGPASLAQLRTDGVTAIATGGSTPERSLRLRGTVSDPDGGQTVKLQVEVRPVGTAFAYVATHESALVASGTTVSIAGPALVAGTGYHWHARAVDSAGGASAWVAFGGNAESAADFVAGAAGPTLGAAPASVPRGGSVTATWSGVAGAAGADWLGLYAAGAADGAYLARMYVNCAPVPGGPVAAGSCAIPVPPAATPGAYEIRLYRNNTLARIAVSNPFTVTDGGGGGNAAPGSPTALAQLRADARTAIPIGGVTDGATVTLRGAVTDPDAGPAVRLQVEVRPLGAAFTGTATHESAPVSSGAVAAVTASGLLAGTSYHWRARAVDSAGGASAWVAFGGNAETPEKPCRLAGDWLTPPRNTNAAPKRGAAVTATWSGVSSPSTADWIGLYRAGSGDGAYLDRTYVSCTQTPGPARAAGSCVFSIPAGVAVGAYELRLFRDDALVRIAVSNRFIVVSGN